MRVVEIYKASDSVEAHLLCQALEEEGINCQIVGGHIESLYGFAHAWNRPSIVVSEEDEGQARKILAARLPPPPEEPPSSPKFQYGLRALVVNFMLVAVILAFYRPMGPVWRDFALGAFVLLFVGNVLALINGRKRRRPNEAGETNNAE